MIDTKYFEPNTVLPEALNEFLNKFKLKHATIPEVMYVKYMAHPINEKFGVLYFYDSKLGEPNDKKTLVGAVGYERGKRGETEYIVSSRLIFNDQYSNWSDEKHQMRSRHLAKCLKNAMQYVVPMRWHELTQIAVNDAKSAFSGWAREFNGSAYILRLETDAIAEELENLIQQGVVFKTESFKKAVESLPKYREFKERISIDVKVDSVVEHQGKYVYIQQGKVLEPEIYDTFETMPEDIRTKLSLLRIVDSKGFIPQVGYRDDNNIFCLYRY